MCQWASLLFMKFHKTLLQNTVASTTEMTLFFYRVVCLYQIM